MKPRAVVVALAMTTVACTGSASGPIASTTTGDAAPSSTLGEQTTNTPAAVPDIPVGTIAWSACEDHPDRECGTLTVPLDYDDPTGATIGLALIRRPADDPTRRIGALLVNPGGPGGSGVEMVAGGFRFDAEIDDRFDLVGFDPRGVGGSAGLDCDGPVETFWALDSSPDDVAEQRSLDTAARAVAEECATAHQDLLPHLGTVDVARDVEAIRLALGEPGLNFYGFSYGTLIALLHADQFPTSVRAIVLDGVVDPAEGFTDFLAGQAVGLQRALEQIFATCGPECPVDDLEQAYRAIAEALEHNPIPLDDRLVGPSALATATISVSYDERDWGDLAEAIADAQDGDGRRLQILADRYNAFGPYGPYAAVECVDSAVPDGSDEFAAFAAELATTSPLLGEAIANELLPCAFWPVEGDREPAPVRADGSPPILVIGKTGDAATPYENAVRVAEALTAGVLLTHEGEGHTSYGESDCVDDAVARYLVDLDLPSEGTVCGPG